MKALASLASLASLAFLTVTVSSACNKTDDSTTCPSGNPQVCLGKAADTCYCTPVSTCDFCTALFNATPGDSDTRCDAYRGQGAGCQSTADCQAAAGAGVSTELVCHAGTDPFASQCVVMCSGDIDCPAGEQCQLGATSSGGVCGRACTATMLYLDAGPTSFPDSGLDGAALATFEAACGLYQQAASSGAVCSACLQTEVATCANGSDGSTSEDPCLKDQEPACETQCENVAVGEKCDCIAGCARGCAPTIGTFYGCLADACNNSCQ